jgi:membrane protein implicated in regulation of membrane protease activity
MTFSKSLGSFVALSIVVLVLIVVIAPIKLPVDVLNNLWYSLVAIIFLTAIAWLAYRRASENRKQQRHHALQERTLQTTGTSRVSARRIRLTRKIESSPG